MTVIVEKSYYSGHGSFLLKKNEMKFGGWREEKAEIQSFMPYDTKNINNPHRT